MKIKNILFVSLFAGAVLSSCDYTDLSPIDSITDKTYWTTTNDLKLYANGLYGLLASPTATGDNTSDNFVPKDYSGYLFNEYTVPASASSSNGWYWNDIRSCNYFLQRYQTVEGSEAEINKYVAEIRFMRGLLYYSKIKQFGDVPWYDKDLQTSDTEELYKARDSRDFVLGKVIEDFEFAIQWLPEKSDSEKGRLNKDAARTQLARICLYFGTYMKYHNETPTTEWTSQTLLQKAVSLTETMMNSGNYDIVKASDAGAATVAYEGYPLYYANLFVQEDLSDCKEGILCRFYEEGVLTHEVGRQVGENGTGLSKDFIESFLMKDGTPIYNTNSGYKGDENQEAEISGRDPRLYQLIDNQHKPYRVQNGKPSQNPVADCSASKSVTGYPCTKYHSANTKQAEARNTYYDWFVYRYAEVLLINAEAHAELGDISQSILDKTINKLRDRVEMAHLTMNPVADAAPVNYGYQLSNLLYEIRRERRIELVAENHRLDDLKRWNAMKLMENPKTMFGLKITPTVEKEYEAVNVTFGGDKGRPVIEYQGAIYLSQYPSKAIDDAGRKWSNDDRRWLYPLPTNELVLNPNLVQNPNW